MSYGLPGDSSLTGVVFLYPFPREFGKTLYRFVSEKRLIDVPHMEHIDDSTEIWSSA